jgi:hypothetical protein
MSLWIRACEHEQIYLEYSYEATKYFKNIPMPCRNIMENIFQHVHG